MWEPIIEALPAGMRAIALDLPGHGGSPRLAERGLAPVVEAVHAAVEDAGIERPIVVGHSIGGPIASIYAATYPAAGVVSIEAPIRFEAFAAMLAATRPQLAGPGFDEIWAGIRESLLMERVPAAHRELLRAADHASQEVFLSYQADLLERPLDEVTRWRDEGMARVGDAGIPYVVLLANPVDPADELWLTARVPAAEVVVWPVQHHFPQLADPAAFADLVAGVAARRPVRGGSRPVPAIP